MSFTEEQLLEAQASGELSYEAPANFGYDDVIVTEGPLMSAESASFSLSRQQSVDTQKSPKRPERELNFEDVPLIQRKQAGVEYKLKVVTADKLNAGLGNTTVFLEILGTNAVIVQSLPKSRGAFQRGCVDRFSLWSELGDLGQIVALKVWHEGNTLGSSPWCLEKVELDNRLKGFRYLFANTDGEGWIPKGKQNVVIMKPMTIRIDDSEELQEVRKEYEVQLQQNINLSDSDREALKKKLGLLGRPFRALSGLKWEL